MTKKEVDIIVKACCKYGVFSSIRHEADIYFIVFADRIEFIDFEAAKLVTNAFIIEKRTIQKIKKHEAGPLLPKQLNFSKFSMHKKKNTEPGAWGKNRMVSNYD